MFMRFRGGGVGHKTSRSATDFFKNDRDKLDNDRRGFNPDTQADDDIDDIQIIDEEGSSSGQPRVDASALAGGTRRGNTKGEDSESDEPDEEERHPEEFDEDAEGDEEGDDAEEEEEDRDGSMDEQEALGFSAL